MKTILLFSIAILSFIPFTSVAQSKNKCSEWMQFSENGFETKLFLRTCEEVSNNSASLEIKNSTEKDVKLTYLVDFNNGESTTGTVIIDLDDKTPKIVCMNCIETKGGGIKSWKFKEIIFKESDGFDKK